VGPPLAEWSTVDQVTIDTPNQGRADFGIARYEAYQRVHLWAATAARFTGKWRLTVRGGFPTRQVVEEMV
jgi:hypothetical protein